MTRRPATNGGGDNLLSTPAGQTWPERRSYALDSTGIIHSHMGAQMNPESLEETMRGDLVSESQAGPQRDALSTFPWMQQSQAHYYSLISHNMHPPPPPTSCCLQGKSTRATHKVESWVMAQGFFSWGTVVMVKLLAKLNNPLNLQTSKSNEMKRQASEFQSDSICVACCEFWVFKINLNKHRDFFFSHLEAGLFKNAHRPFPAGKNQPLVLTSSSHAVF